MTYFVMAVSPLLSGARAPNIYFFKVMSTGKKA